MKKTDLHKLQKITEMQSHVALAKLATVAAELTATQVEQEVLQSARSQARTLAETDPGLGRCAEQFDRWASSEARVLQERGLEQQRLLDRKKDEAIRAFGRKVAVEKLRQL
jgi:hypothetical protein